MTPTLPQAFIRNFLGHSPGWYKLVIVAFLVLNPLVLAFSGYDGPVIVSWLILLEFVFTLAMALKCYPLQPGGLIAIEAVLMKLVSPSTVYHEVEGALPVLLLLIFMLAGIYFLKDLLLSAFTRLVLGVRSQTMLALLVLLFAALLAAFLNAITVVALVLTIAGGFYQVFHKVASGKTQDHEHDHASDLHIEELHRSDLDALRGFLRSLTMTAAVGAAIGGAFTSVGQPQNLLIAQYAQWNFTDFFRAMAPIAWPMLGIALVLTGVLQASRRFGYGVALPESVRHVLVKFQASEREKHNARTRSALIVQLLAAAVLVVALVTQAAEVGLVGLLVIILVTSFTGITEEHRIGKAFTDVLPFTALVIVFFVIVAVLREQHAFEPMLSWVLTLSGSLQRALLFVVSGVLSALSDNVFVGALFATELKAALLTGALARDQFEALAVAANMGPAVLSLATPNGQAGLLLVLTSTVAPLIRLSYGRMVWMALPFVLCSFAVGVLLLR